MKKRFTFLLTAIVCMVCLIAAACVSTGPSAHPLEETELKLTVGQQYTLNANVTGDDVDWEVSEKSVLTLETDGATAVVTAKSVGTATVTLYKGDEAIAECVVTVEASPLEINLPLGKLVLKKGVTASVRAYFDGTAQGEPVWSSSDETIGTVEAQGLLVRVKAESRGECTISVEFGGYRASFKLIVGK